MLLEQLLGCGHLIELLDLLQDYFDVLFLFQLERVDLASELAIFLLESLDLRLQLGLRVS